MFEQLERVFAKASFQKEVQTIRNEYGIPRSGFTSFQHHWKKWIKSKPRGAGIDIIVKIDDAARKICRELKLPHIYYLWLVAYILLGKRYSEFNPEIPFETAYQRGFSINTAFGCGLELNPDEGCVNIKIYPGISEREIKKFLHDNMDVIAIYLEMQGYKVAPIRKRPSSADHELLYEHYLDKELSASGKYIGTGPMPSIIKKYNMDMRRKLIYQQKRLHQ